MIISATTNFVTNSSSVVHHFPNELLEHPAVKQFMRIFGLTEYVSDDLWNRGNCDSIAFSKERKLDLIANSKEEDGYYFPGIDVEGDTFVTVYGDEYESLASSFTSICQVAAQEMFPDQKYFGGESYN